MEGRDYTVVNGQRIPTAAYLKLVKDGDPNGVLVKQSGAKPYQTYATIFPMRMNATGSNGQANLNSNDTQYLMAAATDTQKEAYKAYGWSTMMDAWKSSSTFKFVPFDITPYAAASQLDPATEDAKNETKIIQYTNKQIPIIANAITDAQFDKLYNDMVKKQMISEMPI